MNRICAFTMWNLAILAAACANNGEATKDNATIAKAAAENARIESEPAVAADTPSTSETTPYSVMSDALDNLRDPARGRDVPITIWYPVVKAETSCPLVIVSHGAGGNRKGHASVAEHLAAHGYVVAAPEHVGSNTKTALNAAFKKRDKEGDKFLDAVEEMVADENERIARPKDVSFAIDTVLSWTSTGRKFKGKIDTDNIGVFGHSYGAYTSAAVSGARLKTMTELKDLSDKRVKAGVALSLQGPEIGGVFSEESYKSLAIPFMIMTGTHDQTLHGQGLSWRKKPFELVPTGGKYLAVLENATHMDFSDSDRNAANEGRRAETGNIVRALALAFFDGYLRSDANALANLSASYVSTLIGKEIPSIEWQAK